MRTIKGVLQASHFGPTLLVTFISYLLATYFSFGTDSWGVAATIFTGQLIVGWTNDLFDFSDDLKHRRAKKPLVNGSISKQTLNVALSFAIPLNVALSLFGPLGYSGGIIAISGVVVALSYNYCFKFNLLSPLPYAICFAGLPFAIAKGAGQSVDIFGLVTGALLGIAAHFLNVLKDLDKDRESGIRGAPQVLGASRSTMIAALFVVAGIFSGYLFFTRS